MWKDYPASMLKSRAITQCARDACEEALFGLHYTPEELGADVDEDGVIIGEIVPDDEGAQDARPARAPAAAPAPARDEAWIDAAIERATKGDPDGRLLDHDGCVGLWRESVRKVHAGEITKPDAARVQKYLTARIEDLAAEANEARLKATALEEDDPWAVKIEAIISREEAEGALAEIAGQLEATLIDAARAIQLAAAIEARFPAPQAAQVAA